MGNYVGHGRHWNFLRAAGRPDALIMGLFYEVYLHNQTNVIFESGDIRLVCEPGVDLGVGELMRGNQLHSAFPYASSGHDWPIEVREVYEWPDPSEGQLLGSCHGARVGWFDPHFAEHRQRYQPLHTMTFRMNALAYRVGRTQFANPEQEALMGQMKAYLPLPGDEASDDELQFSSHVEAVRSLDFHGVPFDVYTVTLALPDDFPMRVDVYAAQSIADESLAVGDRISAACWLFGRLIE